QRCPACCGPLPGRWPDGRHAARAAVAARWLPRNLTGLRRTRMTSDTDAPVTIQPPLIDPAALQRADVRREPFPFLIARDALADDSRATLHADFPAYRRAGFFPYQESDCGP